MQPRESREPLNALEAVASAVAAVPREAIEFWAGRLETERSRRGAEDWQVFCRREVQGNRFFGDLLLSPLAQRSIRKPRGYGADAVMIDMVYWPEMVLPRLEGAARAIYEWEVSRPAAQAIRARRDRMAMLLGWLANARPEARVASIGAGHLREAAGLSERFQQFVAVEEDPKAMSTILSHQPRVQPRAISIGDLMAGDRSLGGYDLIYSLGTLETLSQPMGARLVRELLGKLMPGGRLILMNLTPEAGPAGYWEAMMDWWVEYRTKEQLLDLAMLCPPGAVRKLRAVVESDGALGILELVRE